MNTITKFHKTFGEVTIIASDLTTTTIVIVATGEQKKLLNQFSNLQDNPSEVVKVKKASKVVRELTKDELLNLEYCNRDGVMSMTEKSKLAYRSGRSGISSL
jgi:hypothetical protein